MTDKRYTIEIHEKGSIEDVEHSLMCVMQAEKRAEKDWIKRACSARREMLIRQLAAMKERD